MRPASLITALLIAVLAAGLLAAGLPAPGAAAPGGLLNTIHRRGALIVGVKADFPPFGYIDARGQQVGFDVDLAHEVASLLLGDSSKVKLRTVTSANRISMLRSNEVDAVMASMTITQERKQTIDFTVPYFCSGHLILVKAANASINNFPDLNGRRVSTVKGATGDTVTGILAPRAERITFDQNAEGVLALKEGRTDAFVQDDVLLLGFAKADPSLKVVGWPPRMPGPYGIGVRKGDKDLLGALNIALARIRSTGMYDRMVTKWFGDVAAKLLPPAKCPPDLRF
ncbi:MAG TPA: transporter substrate-binding domain-containing protein [bacterium]|nr:transporter substrate-binding domain-containing protein [bacterium]